MFATHAFPTVMGSLLPSLTQTATASALTFGVLPLIGYITMILIAGITSLVGLGGGALHIIILITLFNMLPKNATIIVYAAIFGSSFGNMINQMRRVLDGKPVVNYRYTTITIPLMFMGALGGVMINQFFPSIVTFTVIVVVSGYKLPQIWKKYKIGRQQQNKILEDHEGEGEVEYIKQTTVNPFAVPSNVRIFEQLLILILCYIALSFLKGGKSMPSIVGITPCSAQYWVLQGVILLFAFGFFQNSLIQFKNQMRLSAVESGNFQETMTVLEERQGLLIRNSVGAGILSGLGLGGGVLLVPLYRQLKLSPAHASSTCSFTVFITSGINVIHALFLGTLSMLDFVLFFTVTAIGSYILSFYLSRFFKNINRLSYVDLILFLLIILISICLPLSLWLSLRRTGGSISTIFGFGTIC